MNILIAGGTGTIGIPLCHQLSKLGHHLRVVSLDTIEWAQQVLPPKTEFIQADLTHLKACLLATEGQDEVYNLLGIKGSVGIGESKVATYYYKMLMMNTNLMEAAFQNRVKKFLFVSSICAYPPADHPLQEDEMWNGMPKANDRYPGIAKRAGEIQGYTYKEQYGWDAVRIVRPSNVYGPFDDFNPATAQVIPALIARTLSGENPLSVWGDGSAIRDFLYADDAAKGMILTMEKAPPCLPINLGAGIGVFIQEVVDHIVQSLSIHPIIHWETSKPTGDKIRVLNIERATTLLNFMHETPLREGIQQTILWYHKNPQLRNYNAKETLHV